jgi:hypothetical protein
MLSRVWLLAFLIVAGCLRSQGQTSPITEPRFKVMSTTQNTDEEAYKSRTYALFRIIDPKYLKEALEKDSVYSRFQDDVNNWIKNSRERWEQIQTRLDYCQGLREQGGLGTDIDGADPDIRWELFIKNGAPTNELILSESYSVGGKACIVWTFIWPTISPEQPGLEISCWSRTDQNYPTKMIPVDDEDFPIVFPIWPFVNYSRFPADDGTVDLWFSVWMPGNQFTRQTLIEAQLGMRIELYDSTKTVLIDTLKQTVNLQILRGVLEATERQDRHLVRAMGYLGVSGVKPGNYNAHLIVTGAPDNDGDHWFKVAIPKEGKVSDLLVLEQSKATGENMLPGIVRGTKSELFDNPECRLAPNSKLELYLETTLPKGHGDLCEIWVTLEPIPEVSVRSNVSVTTGEAVVVADSLDQPFLNGEWGSSRNQKLLEEMADYESHSHSKATTLLKKKIDASEGAMVIEVAARLESDLKSGRYLLTVTISDPKKQNYFLSARRIIRVAPSWSYDGKGF